MKQTLYLIAFIFLLSCGQSQDKKEAFDKEEQANNQKEIADLLFDSLDHVTIKEEEKQKEKEKQIFQQKFILNLDTIKSFNCNISVLAHISTRIDSLTSKEITYFLRTIRRECSNNAEFSQFSSELIFKILEKHPKAAITALTTKGSEIEFSYIYDKLTSPVHDLIPLDKIEKEINSLSFKSERMDSIKSALKIALERYY